MNDLIMRLSFKYLTSPHAQKYELGSKSCVLDFNLDLRMRIKKNTKQHSSISMGQGQPYQNKSPHRRPTMHLY